MIEPNLGRVVVALARQTSRGVDIPEPQARRGDRGDRLLDAVAIHRLDRMLRRPFRRLAGDDQRSDPIIAHRSNVAWRQNMMVDVNTMCWHGGNRPDRPRPLVWGAPISEDPPRRVREQQNQPKAP